MFEKSRLSPFKKSVDVHYKTFNYYSVLMICSEPIVENSAIVNRQSPSEVVGGIVINWELRIETLFHVP